MCPPASSRLWGEVFDCDSQFTILSPLSFDRPQLWCSISVCSFLYLLTRARCSPLISLWLASHLLAPAGGRTQSVDCALRIPGHMTGEELVFFSSLYIKLFELGVEVTFNNWCAVTHHKVNLLKFPLRDSSFERTDDAFVLLIWLYFFYI